MGKLLKSNEIEWVLIIWGIFFFWVAFLVIFLNERFHLNEIWDAMWGIFGTLISTCVFIFVVHSYKLQKEELRKTNEALMWQGESMKDQKMQSLTIELLSLCQNHLETFKSEQSKIYPTSYGDMVQVFLANTNTEDEIKLNIRKGGLTSMIKYFRTLKYAEDMICKTYSWNEEKIKIYIDLLDSQITDNIKRLYNTIYKMKTGLDSEKISFTYLFQ